MTGILHLLSSYSRAASRGKKEKKFQISDCRFQIEKSIRPPPETLQSGITLQSEIINLKSEISS
jgi:hypothetical protein